MVIRFDICVIAFDIYLKHKNNVKSYRWTPLLPRFLPPPPPVVINRPTLPPPPPDYVLGGSALNWEEEFFDENQGDGNYYEYGNGGPADGDVRQGNINYY